MARTNIQSSLEIRNRRADDKYAIVAGNGSTTTPDRSFSSLYVTTAQDDDKDEAQVPKQFLLGVGRGGTFYDASGNVVASTVRNPPPRQVPDIDCDYSGVDRFYDQHTYTQSLQWFRECDVAGRGEYPVLSFVTSIGIDESAEPFLQRLYEVAVAYCAPDVAFTEMLLVCSRAMSYESDHVRHNTSTKRADQWIYLTEFPDIGIAAYDCEDGSALILEIGLTLQRISLRSGQLRRVQDELNQYELAMVLGNLLSNDKWVAHAYVIALDRRYVQDVIVDGKRPGKYRDAFSLESTCWIDGRWGVADRSDNNEQARWIGADDDVYKYRMNGDVTAILFPERRVDVRCRTGERVGVDVHALMTYQISGESFTTVMSDPPLVPHTTRLPRYTGPRLKATPLTTPPIQCRAIDEAFMLSHHKAPRKSIHVKLDDNSLVLAVLT